MPRKFEGGLSRKPCFPSARAVPPPYRSLTKLNGRCTIRQCYVHSLPSYVTRELSVDRFVSNKRSLFLSFVLLQSSFYFRIFCREYFFKRCKIYKWRWINLICKNRKSRLRKFSLISILFFDHLLFV